MTEIKTIEGGQKDVLLTRANIKKIWQLIFRFLTDWFLMSICSFKGNKIQFKGC